MRALRLEDCASARRIRILKFLNLYCDCSGGTTCTLRDNETTYLGYMRFLVAAVPRRS